MTYMERIGRADTNPDVCRAAWGRSRPPMGTDPGGCAAAGAVEYALVGADFGQGPGLTVMPVSRITGPTPGQRDQPYTALEVLTNGFREDFGLVIGHFLELEQDRVRNIPCFRNAQRFRLLSYKYIRTESVIGQPTSATVVDMIVQGKVNAEVPAEGNYGRNGPSALACAAVDCYAPAEGEPRNGRLKDQKPPKVIYRVDYVRDPCEGQVQRMAVYACLDFRLRYILDMRPCERKCIGPIIDICGMEGKDPVFREGRIRTNEFLLPVMYAEEYERAAKAVISTYYPEYVMQDSCLRGDIVINGADLAHRMGLHVREVRFADKTVAGQIFFDLADVEILDTEGTGHTVKIQPGTILISSDHCKSEGIRNSTITHECAHFYLDRQFFMMQMLAGKPYQSCTSRRRGRKRNFGRNTPIDWMELQAEKLPAFVLMERESTKAYVEAEFKKRGRRSCHALRTVLFNTAGHFHVTPAMARIRLIELGYPEMQGIYNYQNGKAIQDHCCSGRWESGITYTITLEDAAALAGRSGAFEQVLRSDRYRYADGHFCLNHSRYLTRTQRGEWYLTPYARSHIDECCISFTVSGRYSETCYQPGIAALNKKNPVKNQYLCGYQFVAEPGTKEYEAENRLLFEDGNRWADFLYHMPDTLYETVQELLDRKRVTQENLALTLDIDRKSLYDDLHTDHPKTGHMVAICVALKLPYYISIGIIEKFGPNLRNTEKDNLYRQMLLMADQLTVERCEEMLAMHKLPPFFKRAA